MKNRRPYKHTQKYIQKKAAKEQLKLQALALRRAKKHLEIQIKLGNITPLFLIYAYMETVYGISEMEMTLGSIDPFLQKLIEVARLYIRETYEKGKEPTPQGLECYFQDYAIEEYCQALGINSEVYDSLYGKNQKENFLQNALAYAYKFAPIGDNVKNSISSSDEELEKSAQKNYEEIIKFDLRKGATERRNSKRFEIVKIILQRFDELNKGNLSIRQLAKEKHINRNTLGRYYKTVKTMLMLGMEINDRSFDEKKRGRKAKSDPLISNDILKQLEKDLEDIPSACGLEYASWTGEAIKEYLKTFYDLEIPLPYLYNYLRAHDIVSKSASRKNPNANPEDIEAFKSSLYSKFKDAIEKEYVVLFLDETHVQQGSRTRGYAKKGKDAVYSYHTENLHCEYTLLTLIGFDFVMIFKHKGSMKSEDYVNYLEELHKKYPDQNFLIFRDNAAIHTCDNVSKSLSKSGTDKFIKFESLPAYCPHLNPVELMNNEFKTELKKFECMNKHDVSVHTDKFINKFQDKEKNSKQGGRRKSRQYFKGNECLFIFNEYLRAMKDFRIKKLRSRKINHSLEVAA